MVESSVGDRGAEEGRPAYAEMNGLHSPVLSLQGKTSECLQVEEHGEQDLSVGLFPCAGGRCRVPLPSSCDRLVQQHQRNSPPLTMKLPNGDVESFSHEVAHTVENVSTKNDDNISNGQLSSEPQNASQDDDAKSATLSAGTDACILEQQGCPVSHDMGVQAPLASPAIKDVVGASAGEQATCPGPGSEPEPTCRPPSLRTLPSNSPVFLSCDSTPLSPDDGQLCPRNRGQQDVTFMDISLNSRNTYEISRRQSAPDNMPGVLSVAQCEQKKHGISDLFGRSLFSRRQKDTKPLSHSAPGWKLFGKVPLRESATKDSKIIQQENNPGYLTSAVSTPNLLSTGEYEAKVGKPEQCPAQVAHGSRKNLEFEPLSTTALILEDRPANLPAKSEEEALRHRQEYDEMVAEAKRRELKEAQRKKKQMKERHKQEEIIANAMLVWNNEILPNWESMRATRKVRDMWWQGLPPNVRGKVWGLAIGNELNITPELYEIFLSRAKERWRSLSETGCEAEGEADAGASQADREASLDLIKLDISRTFPSLFIFQKGGPYHDLLHNVLGAYTCYRPDVGYVQGMSFIAAVLILNLEEADAFIAFANLLNKPCQMAFFRVDHDLMLKYFAAFEVFFEDNLPRLFKHFQGNNLTPDLYLIDWIFTLYGKSLPLDVACRVWDVFCRDGEEYLFRTALGILRLYEDVLLGMDFINMAQFLTRLPDDLPPGPLFSAIATTQMVSSNRKWAQVFNTLMKDKEADRNTSPSMKSSGV